MFRSQFRWRPKARRYRKATSDRADILEVFLGVKFIESLGRYVTAIDAEMEVHILVRPGTGDRGGQTLNSGGVRGAIG